MINPFSIVGLDISLTATGIASGGGTRTVKSKSGVLIEPRVEKIWADIQDAIQELTVGNDTFYCIEGLAFASKTGAVAERSFLHHFVRLELWRAGKSFALIPPTVRKKYAVGRGNAGKDEIVIAVTKLFPEFGATNNNETDAVVAYAMGYAHHTHTPLADLPKVNRDALEKVDWNYGEV